MKYLNYILMIFLLFSVKNSNSMNVTILWNPYHATAEVEGFFIYYGTSSGIYTNKSDLIVPSTRTSYSISNLMDNILYYFAATAFDTNDGLESIYSDEVIYSSYMITNIPPTPIITNNLGLIAAYNFENNTLDISSNNNNGTIIGGASYVNGKFGKSISLNKISQYVLITNRVYSLSGGTLSFWVYVTTGGSAIGSYNGSNQRSPTFSFYQSQSPLGWELGSLTGKTSSSPISTNQWTYIAMTYDSNYNANIYINGILNGSGLSVNPGGFYNQIHIGHYANYGNSYFGGYIDELRIYNRPLLVSEILSDMNNPISFIYSTNLTSPTNIRIIRNFQ